MAGYSIQEIAKVLDLHRKTISNWRKAFDFDEAKDKVPLLLSEIVSRLQRHFQDKMDAGKLTADEVAKYAAAIERLTDKKTEFLFNRGLSSGADQRRRQTAERQQSRARNMASGYEKGDRGLRGGA